ncbi:MAG TPA: SMP-30/gluconolactonase/LRE family protein [Falsiroseomonas sp.]|nr:SMP-30/gluconolactonase/LRE family protein [Falsiroseomonas sp.]
MFAAPPEVTAEVHTRLPDQLKMGNRRSNWLDKKGHAAKDSFLEGPSFDRDGNLYVVDIAHGRIFRITPDREWSVFAQYDGEPNGIAIHRDGRIFVADGVNGILAFDPRGARHEVVAGRSGKGPFKGPNDLTFAPNGDIYFTDQGETGYQDPTGCLYRLRAADGELQCIVDFAPSPNGLLLTEDGHAVLLAVTRDNAVWRVPMRESGETYKVGKMIQLSGSLGSGPDGMAMDSTGGFAVAHAGFGTVWYFDRFGEPRLRIRVPTGHLPTNVAYGGPENSTLFITESNSGTILAAPMPHPGRLLFSHG